MKDIFEPVITKLTQEISESWPAISGDLKKTQARTAGAAPGALIGGIIGFFAGGKSGSRMKDDD